MEQQFWETLLLDQMERSKHEIAGIRVKKIEGACAYPALADGCTILGIDPGVHFGITILTQKKIQIFWGDLPHKVALAGFEALDFIRAFMHTFFEEVYDAHAYIEGPAYSEMIGQPLLEQIRFGFAVGLSNCNVSVVYLQPNQARKLAFGSGTLAGKDIWANINQNGADSIGLALAGAVLHS